jgi:hypothetical protein
MTIRTYTKAELAMLYCPDRPVDVALQTFSRWVKRNKNLTAELHAMGYNKYARNFTPREVEAIVRYLGEG